ncbi:MAG: ATP-binding protein [Oceanicaulis sp.]|nr:ATP-binding protein [Oceanicaulis sp.]
MEDIRSTDWAANVKDVFDTRPRNGAHDNVVWVARVKEEHNLTDYLTKGGHHICVSGPTGSGKSSLVQTCVARMISKGLYQHAATVQLTNQSNFNWELLKKRIFIASIESIPASKFTKLRQKISEQLAPIIGGAANITKTFLLERVSDITKNWDLHSICSFISSIGIILILDDFEKADDEIVGAVSNMLKVMSQSYPGRIIIVGTGDIYSKLIQFDQALDQRMKALTVASMGTPKESWGFLASGFNRLNLSHPGSRSRPSSQSDLRDAIDLVHDCANGLLKSLNTLGQDVSIGALRGSVSLHEIEKASENMIYMTLRQFRAQYRQLHEILMNHGEAIILLKHLIDKGITSWFDVEDIIDELHHWHPNEVIRFIDILVEADFFVRSGTDRNVLFVVKPTMMHVLGTVISKPQKYRSQYDSFRSVNQLSFLFR